MKPFPTILTDTTQPLSELLVDSADQEIIQQLAAQNYEVHLGLTPEFAAAIAVIAEQSSIREYCPRDRAERFKNRTVTEEWLSKGRAVFLLLRRTDEGELQIAGYGWSGRGTSPEVPGGETTFALRINETDQGHGLSAPFAKLILSATTALYGAPYLWLETWASNGGAVHVYHKLGFATVTEKPGDRPTAVGQTVPDVRFYMTLSGQ
jgi:ribosomal protein S18 acetylase RimI-like enzyme